MPQGTGQWCAMCCGSCPTDRAVVAAAEPKRSKSIAVENTVQSRNNSSTPHHEVYQIAGRLDNTGMHTGQLPGTRYHT